MTRYWTRLDWRIRGVAMAALWPILIWLPLLALAAVALVASVAWDGLTALAATPLWYFLATRPAGPRAAAAPASAAP